MQKTELTDDILGITASGTKAYWMISTEMGAKNFELRYLVIPFEGKTNYGKHPHEDEVFIVKGNGKAIGKDCEESLKPGMAIFISENEEHQFINTGAGSLEFICVIPKNTEDQFKPKKQ